MQKTDKYFEAECLNYRQILKRTGISYFKLVKIDIEGAEYGVLDNILKNGNLPEIICVDFDEMNHVINWNTKRRLSIAFSNMIKNGYKPIWIEGDSVTFRIK